MTLDAEATLAAAEAAEAARAKAATARKPKPRRRQQPRRGLAAPLAMLSCALSGSALYVALQPVAPVEIQLPPPPVPLASDAPLPILGIELLLPHLARTAPFPRHFAVARALATGDAEVLAALAPLSAAAREGAPSTRQLAEGFAEAADAAVLAEMGFDADAGWILRRAAATMRLGASLGSSPTVTLHAVTQAAESLAAGDLAATAAALRDLPRSAAAAMAPWREALGRRLAADEAALRLADLSAQRAGSLLPHLSAAR